MTIFGTTMSSFALVGSTNEAYRRGIGVYGLMASWSGLIHSACFFLIGTKLWYHGKRFGYSTQIQFFRDRFQSPLLGYMLFPILVGWVIPYVMLNIIGSGGTIETVTDARLSRPFSRSQRPWRHPASGSARRCLRRRADLCFQRRHAEPVVCQRRARHACSSRWAA